MSLWKRTKMLRIVAIMRVVHEQTMQARARFVWRLRLIHE
jgi:hypothetical protein